MSGRGGKGGRDHPKGGWLVGSYHPAGCHEVGEKRQKLQYSRKNPFLTFFVDRRALSLSAEIALRTYLRCVCHTPSNVAPTRSVKWSFSLPLTFTSCPQSKSCEGKHLNSPPRILEKAIKEAFFTQFGEFFPDLPHFCRPLIERTYSETPWERTNDADFL